MANFSPLSRGYASAITVLYHNTTCFYNFSPLSRGYASAMAAQNVMRGSLEPLFQSPQSGLCLCNSVNNTSSNITIRYFSPLSRGYASAIAWCVSRVRDNTHYFSPLSRGYASAMSDACYIVWNNPNFSPLSRGYASAMRPTQKDNVCYTTISVPSVGAMPLQSNCAIVRSYRSCKFQSPQSGLCLCNSVRQGKVPYPTNYFSPLSRGYASAINDDPACKVRPEKFQSPQSGLCLCNRARAERIG